MTVLVEVALLVAVAVLEAEAVEEAVAVAVAVPVPEAVEVTLAVVVEEGVLVATAGKSWSCRAWPGRPSSFAGRKPNSQPSEPTLSTMNATQFGFWSHASSIRNGGSLKDANNT